MEYTFKQLILTDTERAWLSEILKQDFWKIDLRSFKVKMIDKFPSDFKPEKIDSRLVHSDHLTLIGLWYLDPNNVFFNHVSKTFEVIRNKIKQNSTIKEIYALEIASLADIKPRDAEIALFLMFDLDNIFSSGTYSDTNSQHGFVKVSFKEDNTAYDPFLRFESLEILMEQFFVNHTPKSNENSNKSEIVKSSILPQTSIKQKSSMYTWNEIFSEFDINKRAFGKKINFVTDKYKRKVIFRDVEQAFILAKTGFYKPAVILSGSVIEELLRQYLKHNTGKTVKGTFEEIINACEEKVLLKKGIGRLSDSIAYSGRNLPPIPEITCRGFRE